MTSWTREASSKINSSTPAMPLMVASLEGKLISLLPFSSVADVAVSSIMRGGTGRRSASVRTSR